MRYTTQASIDVPLKRVQSTWISASDPFLGRRVSVYFAIDNIISLGLESCLGFGHFFILF